MGNASISFLFFASVACLIYNLRTSLVWRQMTLFLTNLLFLCFLRLSIFEWLPMAGYLAVGFIALQFVRRFPRTSMAVPVTLGVAGFVWLKRYSFVPHELLLRNAYVTLGLSYVFFRVLHILIDARNGELRPDMKLVAYLNYTLNFTTFLSGPIQRYQDFANMQLTLTRLPLNAVLGAESLERIVIGFFKVNVLSLLLSFAQTQAILSFSPRLGLGEKISKACVIFAVYPFYLYCNFSGYIDIVIGVARFFRLELPENFNRPFAADNFINFWSRWHITLSSWLKTYVYNPLLITSMRRYPQPAMEPYLGVVAFFVTFFLVGLWHGQTFAFLFFGVLQGAGVSAVKLFQIWMTKRLGRKRYREVSSGRTYTALARGLTFSWFAFSLLWFWSSWSGTAGLFHDLGPVASVAVWVVIFLGSSILLEAWEIVRAWALSLGPAKHPLVLSRYLRTVWGTALAVIALGAIALLNTPAPDIVYKGF
jgi:alginate O-acetyltransferase complex protein AlgI